MEVFFRALEPEEIADIAFHSAERAGFTMTREDARMVGRDVYKRQYLNHYFSHTSPTYGSAAQMLSAYGYALSLIHI